VSPFGSSGATPTTIASAMAIRSILMSDKDGLLTG
jgi:hypothetical protein